MISPVAKTKPDETKKACYDCRYMQAAVSWWCVNEEACNARGTKIPGVHDCPYWKPMDYLYDYPWWARIFVRIFRMTVK